MKFDERIFLYALTRRNADAERFGVLFKPEWLDTVQYRPLLNIIYRFTKEKGIPPSFGTIRTILQREDEIAYKNRYEQAIDSVEKMGDPDESQQIDTLEMAKNVAISRSLRNLFSTSQFREMNEEFDGQGQIKILSDWLHTFTGQYEKDKISTWKEVIDSLTTADEWDSEIKLSCGIKPLDEWCGGGLYTKQLAIIGAPSAGGKSICLANIAYHMANVEHTPVLYITNELTDRETAIRWVTRMTPDPTITLTRLGEDHYRPELYKGLNRFWVNGGDRRIIIWDASNREDMCCTDIEAALTNLSLTHGWKPHAIVLDYMERMKPNTLMGLQRSDTSNWYGAVARDLVKVGKRHNALVWTAAQVNRIGLDAVKPKASHLQGSIKHLQEATALFILRKLRDASSQEYFDFFLIKMRHASGIEGARKTVPVNLEKMHIGSEHVVVDIKKEAKDEEIGITDDYKNKRQTQPR